MLLAIYAGSGMTALAYEVLWTRMLSLMFGVQFLAWYLLSPLLWPVLGWGVCC